MGGNAAITVGRIRHQFTPLYTSAANKDVQIASLAIAGQTLTINNNNGYDLQVAGVTTLSGAPTFNVATASASNVLQGLILGGQITSATGAPTANNAVILAKSGAGTLVLGSSANSGSFGGLSGATGQIIDITAGILAAGSDNALGNSSNVVRINTNSATQGFRATGSINTSRTFILQGAAANGLDVTNGNTLTLNSALSVTTPGTALDKNDLGTVVLAVANPTTWTGGALVNQGILQLNSVNSLGLGTATGVILTSGAEIDLNGSGLTFGNAFTASAGTGINSAGA